MSWLPAIGGVLGGAAGFLLGGPAGAAIGAGLGGSLGSTSAGYKAQNKATEQASTFSREGMAKAEDMYKNATDEQKKYLDQFLGYMQPYIGLGNQALPDYSKFLTLDPELSPTYQWQKKHLLSELPKSLAPSGLMRSGVRDQLTAQGIEGLLAGESDKIYGRYMDAINLGYGASGAAGGGIMQAGSNLANLSGNLANVYAQGGENQANIALAQGQAKTGLYSNLAQMPFNAFNAYTNYNLMDRLFPKSLTAQAAAVKTAKTAL